MIRISVKFAPAVVWEPDTTVRALCSRWRALKIQMIEKRSKLGESQTLQQFSRDVDEIEAWISEKLQTASDESYKDPTNIQVCFPAVLLSRFLTSPPFDPI